MPLWIILTYPVLPKTLNRCRCCPTCLVTLCWSIVLCYFIRTHARECEHDCEAAVCFLSYREGEQHNKEKVGSIKQGWSSKGQGKQKELALIEVEIPLLAAKACRTKLQWRIRVQLAIDMHFCRRYHKTKVVVSPAPQTGTFRKWITTENVICTECKWWSWHYPQEH
jgi:hypothetical protein